MTTARLGRATVYAVQSETDPHTIYLAAIFRNGEVACSCPAGQQSKPCKHTREIQRKESA